MSVPPKEDDAIVSQTVVAGLHVLAGTVQMPSVRRRGGLLRPTLRSQG